MFCDRPCALLLPMAVRLSALISLNAIRSEADPTVLAAIVKSLKPRYFSTGNNADTFSEIVVDAVLNDRLDLYVRVGEQSYTIGPLAIQNRCCAFLLTESVREGHFFTKLFLMLENSLEAKADGALLLVQSRQAANLLRRQPAPDAEVKRLIAKCYNIYPDSISAEVEKFVRDHLPLHHVSKCRIIALADGIKPDHAKLGGRRSKLRLRYH